jgi:hypothetical protein
MKRPARVPSQLSASLHKRLNAYALAASAAGVGVLALAHPAEARIVYTPAHVKIEPNQLYNIDLNHDGKFDFTLSNHSTATSLGTHRGLLVSHPKSNNLWESNRYATFAADPPEDT